MLGKYAVMEQFILEGVRHLFGNPGSTELALMDALQDYPQIQYILALQEASVVAMADGYARASGRPAVANVHIAPGLANSMSMLYNAWKGGTPIVLTAGQQDSRSLLQEPLLSGDLARMARPWTKWSAEVNHAKDLPMALRRAFKVAAEPPQGPVFLSFPQDILDQKVDGKIVPTAYSSWRTRPDSESVERAAQALAQAQRPLILCGDGLAVSRAQDEAAELAALAGATVLTVTRSEYNFPTSHPTYAGGMNIWGGRTALDAYDVVLVVGVGSSLFASLWYQEESPLPDGTILVQIDIDSWEISKNYPAGIGLICDPKMGLIDLTKAVDRLMTPSARTAARERVDRLRELKAEAKARAEERVKSGWNGVPISPLRLIAELKAAMKPHTVLVGSGGTSGGAAVSALMDFDEPGSYFGGRGGSLGFGIPGALGVKLALPERPVVALAPEGDGMYTIQALWTAAHYNIPVTFVIVNNASYRILKMNMVRYLGESGGPSTGSGRGKSRFIGMDFGEPELDYSKYANAFGIHGVRVDRPDDIRPALKEALDLGGPAVVDVVVDGSYEGYF